MSSLPSSDPASVTNSEGWRPPNWSQPQDVTLTVTIPGLPEASVSTSSTVNGLLVEDTSGSPSTTTEAATQSQNVTYFFDAVMRVDHVEEVIITSHPVQAGAAISDHAYKVPTQIYLDVKFSDAQQSYDITQYTGGTTKSVAAYQAFKYIKDNHLLCRLTTKLDTYENMLIESITAPESLATIFGVHMLIRLKEIIVGVVSVSTVSARPQQIDETQFGTLNGETPDQATINQLQGIANPNQWNNNTKPNLLPSN